MSNLRSYTLAELHGFADTLDGPAYRWRAGRVRSIGLSRVTFLVGWPEKEAVSSPR